MKNNTREIKFRVWDENKGKYLVEQPCPDSPIVSIALDGSLMVQFYSSNTKTQTGFTAQQYVGIRDKNSKEIYEGDIIACSFFYSPETTITGVVEFSLETLNYVVRYNTVPDQEDGSGFTPQESLEDLHMVSDIEIIGNVFENGDITPGAARPC